MKKKEVTELVCDINVIKLNSAAILAATIAKHEFWKGFGAKHVA